MKQAKYGCKHAIRNKEIADFSKVSNDLNDCVCLLSKNSKDFWIQYDTIGLR